MSFGVKTADGVIPIHSVHVKPTTVAKTITANDTYTAADDNADGYSSVTVNVDTNLTVSQVPLEDGGLMNSSVGEILSPNDSINNRCRGSYAVLLAAGEYEIAKSTTAPADLQINVSAYQRDRIYDSILSRDLYVLATSIPGYWSESGQPFALTLSAPAYISIIVRKSDNTTLSAADAGGYVIIRKT